MYKTVLFVLLLCPVILFSITINVPADYVSIQEAIDAANHNDLILVAPGIYNGAINFLGKRIIVASYFHTEQDTTYIGNTIIDGNQEVYTVVTFNSSENNNSKLIGFTIRGGNANGSDPDIAQETNGGGLFITNNSNPVISNCVIIDNHADWRGGGIFVSFANPIIIDCHIANNSAQVGGGVFFLTVGNSVFENNTVKTNNALRGGGLFLYGIETARFNLIDCIIAGNSAEEYGGGIVTGFVLKTYITRTLFYNNSAEYGGAISLNNSPMAESVTNTFVVNSTLAYNTAAVSGGSIHLERNSNALLVNTISYFNTPQEVVFSPEEDSNSLAVAYTDIQGGESGILTNGNGTLNWLNGNIDHDPLFTDAETFDFTLTENSPCIDTAVNYFYHSNTIIVNLDEQEYYGDAPDMGAFEYWGVSTGHFLIPPTPKNRIDAYPNPFNPEINITMHLAQSGNASLNIYNIKGQKVITLAESFLENGFYEYHWNGRDGNNNVFPSGIYSIVLNQNDHKTVSKITLLK